MANSLKLILLLLAAPCILVLGYQVLDWVYVYEITGRYMVLGGLVIVIGLLWLLRNVKYRYLILAIFLCLMTVKSDHYIRNWERGYAIVNQWLESNPPGTEQIKAPPSVYFNAQICTAREPILRWMLKYYWGELRPRYIGR